MMHCYFLRNGSERKLGLGIMGLFSEYTTLVYSLDEWRTCMQKRMEGAIRVQAPHASQEKWDRGDHAAHERMIKIKGGKKKRSRKRCGRQGTGDFA